MGVNISSNLSWNTHIDSISIKASQRTFILYRLKHSGLDPHEIIAVFMSIIRPLLEYACQVWHTCLTMEQSNKLESFQKRACRIAAPNLSYSEALTLFKLTRLSERREQLCNVYFQNMLQPTHKLHHLLPAPKTHRHNLRASSNLPVPRTRTERHKKSFYPTHSATFRIRF